LSRIPFLCSLALSGLSVVAVAQAPAPQPPAPQAPVVAPATTPNFIPPVTRGASPEAVALLRFIQENSGRGTLAGQHGAPLVAPTRLPVAQRQTGRYPAIFGQDFGFDLPGSWDGINFRQQLVDEAIRRHGEGFIITLMWHAVRPIEDEPVQFGPSIQGKLTDAQWKEMITPGTRLNERWKSQVDVIASYLRQLRDARVPVLWRPYHEMNGGWFWWGKKGGETGYKRLWAMLYDRLVNFHGLNNLIWVYNCNELTPGQDAYETYYPGANYVDILATDVYRGGFAAKDYEEMLRVANGKPIALGEVGTPPSIEILRAQPKWSWFMVWGDPEGAGGAPGATRPNVRQIYSSEQVVTRDELPWVKSSATPTMHFPTIR
jgi:mannan endo-1,4-beta-mannosidase